MTDTTAPTPIVVKDGEIPLPPREMWGELANDGPAATGEPAATAPKQVAASVSVAALEYVGAETPFRTIPLRYPFRWDGVEVTAIVVRALTVQEVGDFMDGLPNPDAYRRTDLYGLMCALPGDVIRALRGVDGRRVTDACYDFLLPGDEGGTA
jgi:hypothetical protein